MVYLFTCNNHIRFHTTEKSVVLTILDVWLCYAGYGGVNLDKNKKSGVCGEPWTPSLLT